MADLRFLNVISSRILRTVTALAACGGVVAWIALAADPALPPAVKDAAPASVAPSHAVVIRKPDGPPRVQTGTVDAAGRPVTVACSTCHTTMTPNAEIASSAELDQFHQGLRFTHGSLACVSCHNPENYDALRLASGKTVEFVNVMTLCAQCHGTQMRDYQNGAHGGMNGYWDLSQGPRTRNNCVNCHDPHSPAYPLAMPVFPPRDRVSVKPSTEKAH